LRVEEKTKIIIILVILIGKREIAKKSFGSNYKGKEGKFYKNKFGENENNERKRIGNGKECWECGKEGHFRSECPGRQENKE